MQLLAIVAGGGGYVDGVGTVAKFNAPYGVSVDSTGNVWIADTHNHMIRQINTAGRVQYCIYNTHIYSACRMSVCGKNCFVVHFDVQILKTDKSF